MKILVVEDDRAIRETLGIVLESYNYEVELKDGPGAALKYLSATWPDLMLLDLRMEGMGGEELYQTIQKKHGATPPTIVISAVQHGEECVRHMPGVKFLSKPYTLDALIAVVEEMTRGRRSAA